MTVGYLSRMHRGPETEAAKWYSAIIPFNIYIDVFLWCFLWKDASYLSII